jgi:hypothetical protein
VPEADESVLAWIGAQSDLSASVRSLIREAIERHGYRDATCYPVQQQPRRGRPPKLETIDGHPIPEQIAALEPEREPEQELLMVPVSHEDVTDEPDESTGFDEAVNSLNDMEDVLGALR